MTVMETKKRKLITCAQKDLKALYHLTGNNESVLELIKTLEDLKR